MTSEELEKIIQEELDDLLDEKKKRSNKRVRNVLAR